MKKTVSRSQAPITKKKAHASFAEGFNENQSQIRGASTLGVHPL
jgi:hypothetical protein